MSEEEKAEFSKNYLHKSTFGYYYSMIALDTKDRHRLLSKEVFALAHREKKELEERVQTLESQISGLKDVCLVYKAGEEEAQKEKAELLKEV